MSRFIIVLGLLSMLFAPFGLLAADDTNTLGAGLKSVAETAGYDQDLANYDNPLAQVVSRVKAISATSNGNQPPCGILMTFAAR
mgnify:CR=1 FL=1